MSASKDCAAHGVWWSAIAICTLVACGPPPATLKDAHAAGNIQLHLDGSGVTIGTAMPSCPTFSALTATLDGAALTEDFGGGERTTLGNEANPETHCDGPHFVVDQLPGTGTHSLKISDATGSLELGYVAIDDFSGTVLRPADGKVHSGDDAVEVGYTPQNALIEPRGLELPETSMPLTVTDASAPGHLHLSIAQPSATQIPSAGEHAGQLVLSVSPGITTCTADLCSVDTPAQKTVAVVYVSP